MENEDISHRTFFDLSTLQLSVSIDLKFLVPGTILERLSFTRRAGSSARREVLRSSCFGAGGSCELIDLVVAIDLVFARGDCLQLDQHLDLPLLTDGAASN